MEIWPDFHGPTKSPFSFYVDLNQGQTHELLSATTTTYYFVNSARSIVIQTYMWLFLQIWLDDWFWSVLSKCSSSSYCYDQQFTGWLWCKVVWQMSPSISFCCGLLPCPEVQRWFGIVMSTTRVKREGRAQGRQEGGQGKSAFIMRAYLHLSSAPHSHLHPPGSRPHIQRTQCSRSSSSRRNLQLFANRLWSDWSSLVQVQCCHKHEIPLN